jgi:hypothetical protein
MKFVGDGPDSEQLEAYAKIAGKAKKVDLMREGVECNCHDDHVPEPQPVVAAMPASEDEPEVNWGAVGKTAVWGTVTAVAAVATVAAFVCPIEGPAGESIVAAGTVGAASRTAAAFSNIFRVATAF